MSASDRDSKEEVVGKKKSNRFRERNENKIDYRLFLTNTKDNYFSEKY